MSEIPSLPGLAVLNFVDKRDYDKLKGVLAREEFAVWPLEGESVDGKSTLFEEVGKQVFQGQTPRNWQDVRSQFEEKLTETNATKIALVWTDVERMLASALADLIQMADILTWLARESYENGVVFVTFFIDSGPNFPALNTIQ